MARRRGKSKSSGIPTWALALGAGAGVYFLTRGSSAVTLPPLPTPTSTPQPSTPRRGTQPQDEPVRTDIGATEALVRRLQADTTAGSLARQVFYVQSVLYSYGGSPDFPDGLLGPDTWDRINTVRARAGLPQSTMWNSNTPGEVVEAIKMRAGSLPNPRILPFALPSSIIDRINREVVPLAGRGAPVLQAYAV